ncbi:MAG: hypothetical protein LIO56_01890 [Lachnospiraceae bacterium]|nr:hypothetical protein [Lachnospiraceae bacterium]
MSQEKVDEYKMHKKNRQQEMAKARQRKILVRVILILVAAVIVFWIVWSAYHFYLSNREIGQIAVNLSEISNYLDGL